MHEIVTLQFGQRANYLATHFWNLQESYFTYTPNTEPSIIDHDIHFRPGIGTDGSDTYTPRTVIYDLKGGFGTLRQRNALYDDAATTSSQPHGSSPAGSGIWNENGLTTIKQQPIQPTSYQADLDAGLPTSQLRREQVRYWSDFNRVFFHPRSIVQLNEYTLSSQLTPFESWGAGEELFRDVDREADSGVLDRDVRLFVEECDSFQGFQVFAGVDDAWGGWTSAYVDGLRDEFGKKGIWVYGLEEDKQVQREKAVARKANAARSLSGISKLADGYVRLSTAPDVPEYVMMGGASNWESTALMAAAAESVTLPLRLRDGVGRGSSMAQFEQTLNADEGRNLWELGLKIDWDGQGRNVAGHVNGDPRGREIRGEDEGDVDDAETFDVNFMPESNTLLPNTLALADRRQPRKHVFTQIDTARHPKRSSNGVIPSQSLDREELLRRRYNEEAIIERFDIPLGFPQLDAYPVSLFKAPDRTHASQGQELSLFAGLTTSSRVKQNIFELRDLVTRYSRAVGIEEKEELYNGLTEVGDKFAFGWEEEESGEDD